MKSLVWLVSLAISPILAEIGNAQEEMIRHWVEKAEAASTVGDMLAVSRQVLALDAPAVNTFISRASRSAVQNGKCVAAMAFSGVTSVRKLESEFTLLINDDAREVRQLTWLSVKWEVLPNTLFPYTTLFRSRKSVV